MNIAELGIKIDSADAAQAATDLDKMAQAGQRAEVSATDLMDEMKALDKALSDGAKSTQEVAKQRDALNKLAQAGVYSETDLAKVHQQLDKSQASLAKSSLDQQKELNSLLSAIDPARAAMQRLDKQVEDLGKAFDAGHLSQDEYSAALDKIDEGNTKVGGSTKAARENVLQLGNALAEGNWRIAAHNIAELAAGAGASAGAIAAIAAPIALVAAAIGGLTYAYLQGEKEGKAYNQALILTGSAAGVTAGQLGEMAKQVGATVGTTGAAADALAGLVTGGKIAGDSLQEVAKAAVSMHEATGKAVSDTVEEFVKLADEPVKASAALNEQYHYLTESVYSQIEALEKQGDHAGAVKLATDQYADAINQRTPKIIENLSLWEKAYREVAKAADDINNIGRPESDDQTITELTQKAAYLQSTVGTGFEDSDAQSRITDIKDQIQFLKDKKAAQLDDAKYDSDKATSNQKAITAAEKIDEITKSNLTNEQKRTEALKEYSRWLDDIRKVNPNDARLNQTTVDKTIADINDKNKDPKAATSPVDPSGFNDAKNSLSSILDTYKNYEKELDATQRAGVISQSSFSDQRVGLLQQEATEVQHAYEQEIAALEAAKNKSTITANQRIELDQKIADVRAEMLKAQQSSDSELSVIATNEEARLHKQALAVKTYTDALQQQVDTLKLQGQRAVGDLGLGDRQKSLTDQQNAIDDRINQQKLDLANQYGDGSRGMGIDEYNQKLAALNRTQTELKNTTVANYNDMTAAQSDWSTGASSAYQNYLESARDISGQTKSLFTNAFSSMEDAIVSFATTGKLSFKDFATSILADMARIALRQASSSVLSSLFGVGASALGSAFGGGASNVGSAAASAGYSTSSYAGAYGFDTGGYTGNLGKHEVAGVVHGGEVVIRKDVVDQPGMKDYLVNLNARGYADGGFVSASSAGMRSAAVAAAPVQVNTKIHIANDGTATSTSDTSGQANGAKQLASLINDGATKVIAKESRAGGLIWRMVNGRS